MQVDQGTMILLAWLWLSVCCLLGIFTSMRHQTPAGIIVGLIIGGLGFGFLGCAIPAFVNLCSFWR